MERLNAALNAHDLEAFLACFQDDYESEQPAHPDRAFRGREQVRSNWSAVFDGVPDFRSELLRSTAEATPVERVALARNAIGRDAAGYGRCVRVRYP